MPYNIKKFKSGYRVHGPSGPKSKEAMSLPDAKNQMKALYANMDPEEKAMDETPKHGGKNKVMAGRLKKMRIKKV